MLALGSCSKRQETREVQPVNRRAIESVLEQHSPELMRQPGVVGVYQSAREDGAPVITVMVLDSTSVASIPHELDGYPVDVEVSGPIRPFDGAR